MPALSLKAPCSRLLQTIFPAALIAVLSLNLRAADWRPVSPAELAMKHSSIDPDADAEALFREVRVLNQQSGVGYPENVITEYVRIKIFTDRGKDQYGTVQIPYRGKSIVSDVVGRTIRRDGTVVELGKDAVFKKTVTKGNGITTKVVSFAMPAVEAGSIIEYRWRLNVGEYISRYLPLDVQSEYPTDEVTFHIKPVSSQWVQWPTMRYLPFGCIPEKGATDREGFSTISVHNVPALREEPEMPPEYSVKQWILIYYEENEHTGGDKYWKALGKSLYSDYSSKVKVNGDIKAIANEQIAGITSEEEKISRLAEYCRKNLKNVYRNEVTTEERSRLKQNRTTVDTLKQKEGTSEDINLAFAALAIGAGFDARLARLSDRGTFLFTPDCQSGYFLNSYDIAVKVNEKWRFYDLSNPNLPIGQLSWREEGVPALVTDPKDPEFVTTPVLKASESQLFRVGELRLSADGDIEGDIRQMYTGNKATEWRERFALANDEERETALRDDLKHRFAEFELSNAVFHLAPDPAKGLSITYHIKVHGYTQRTGKRLFVMPDFFAIDIGPRFSDGVRHQPIYFRYPWSEFDSIELQLPEGYVLDHGDAPASFSFLPVGKYTVSVSITKTNKIKYARELVFGSDNFLLFGPQQYSQLKQIFDRIHEADNHMLALKAEAPVSASVQ